MRIEYDFPLKPLNTFGIAARARYFAGARSVDDVREALAWAGERRLRTFILGGGSNILFTEDVDGLVLHMKIQGIGVHERDSAKYLVTAAAGDSWAGLVRWAVERGYGGIENLSGIPGTAGAAPIQNIGAYGVEFSEICHSVTALERDTGKIREFSAGECCFGYRDSFFKHHAEKWIILAICVRLDRNAPLRLEYGALKETLSRLGKMQPCIADVRESVLAIRAQKLPEPKELGSAGSFFKNPVVPISQYRQLRARYPGMPGFAQKNGMVKLSAAWLLETAGWKGKKEGRVGCYSQQPLVLINHGDASGQEVLCFSQDIQKSIADSFGISLERETVLYP